MSVPQNAYTMESQFQPGPVAQTLPRTVSLSGLNHMSIISVFYRRRGSIHCFILVRCAHWRRLGLSTRYFLGVCEKQISKTPQATCSLFWTIPAVRGGRPNTKIPRRGITALRVIYPQITWPELTQTNHSPGLSDSIRVKPPNAI